jgi:transposase
MHENVSGIDISKDKFDVALIAQGKTLSQEFSNDNKGFKMLVAWFKRYEVQPHACMEATGVYGVPLATFLFEKKIPVSVVNPARIKGFSQSELSRNKTDKVDAKIIARFCQAMNPSLWEPAPEWQVELKEWLSHLDNLKTMMQQEKNRLSATMSKSLPRAIRAHIKDIEKRIKKTNLYIEKITESSEELLKKRKLLETIPGIGTLTACKLVSFIGNVENFKTAKQLAAFAGVSPRQRQSGSSVKGKTRMCKTGDPKFRCSLYMPAVVAMKHNPILKRFYEGLLAKGKAKKSALGAVMRKLLHIAYGILKNETAFCEKPKLSRIGA